MWALEAEEYDRAYNDKDLFRRILVYFGPYKKSVFIVILFLVLSAFANALVPILLAMAISNLIKSKETSFLLLLLALTFVLGCLGWVFNYFRQVHSTRVIGDMVLDLRNDVNTAVLNQDLSFFDKYPTGKIVSRVNTDSRDFGNSANQFMQTVSSFLVVAIIITVMFSINPRLAMIVVLLIPIIFVFALSFRKIARKWTLLGQRSLAVVNAYVQESISGISVAKTFRQEDKLHSKFNEVNDQAYRVNWRRGVVLMSMFPMLTAIQGIMIAIVIYFGGESLSKGEIDAGELFLFLQSLWFLFFPLLSIASFWPQFQAGLSASERIFALIDTPPVVLQNDDQKPTQLRGEIIFDKLQFAYAEGQPIFDDFSLAIHPGESVAIVGHTGAGKSSLAKLLARFYEFQGGDILIDGASIRDFDLHAYRKQIGIIAQTPFLWGDTLENNVRYGKPDASREEVLWALKQAGGADWVEDLPNGLETNIRERGSLLSMGQRQLVAFARVLLENPSILILDEATASVDPFTETRIQDAVQQTIAGRTSIVIAHRLWTVRHVDRIVVLDHGKIVEEGNHSELMAKGGHYANLYSTYFRHQSLEYIEQAKKLA